jgi:hypothetical protein
MGVNEHGQKLDFGTTLPDAARQLALRTKGFSSEEKVVA